MPRIFPSLRLKRLRKLESIRALVRETKLSADNFIMPYFITDGKDKKEPIPSMPGVFRLSIDNLMKEIDQLYKSGIKAVLLFGVTGKKDEKGTGASKGNGVLQRAIRQTRSIFPYVSIFSDVCLCGYTRHGHCGIVKKSKIKNQKSKIQTKIQNFYIDNDETIKILSKIALSHAEAGVDFVAPSGMVDGQVLSIRKALDENSFGNVGILSYSAKYCSSFYGPFRDALDSSPGFGDRSSYQMDISNINEALREVEADIKEGADIVMVKPALSFLDVIRAVRDNFNIPIAAYNVSGEYSMVKAAAREGLCDERKTALEILVSMKRAGADMIITYFAKEAAKWIA